MIKYLWVIKMSKKKIKSKKIEVKETENLEQFDSVLKLSVIVILVFVIFYVITGFLTETPKKVRNQDEVIGIVQYDEILSGETFNKSHGEYYVLFIDLKSPDATTYNLIASNYKKNMTAIPLYSVDLSKKFNSPFVFEESNKNVSKAADLKISGSTLMKIKNGKNVLYVEGLEAIEAVLK